MLELETTGAVEVDVVTPNAGAVDAETAGVVALLANENPVPKEAVDADEVDAVLPKPAKDDPPLVDDEPAPVDATGAAVNEKPPLAGAEDAAVVPKAGTDAETIAAPVAVVEAVVVVTVEVENKGAEDVVNEKEPAGFEADGVPETAEAAEDEAEELNTLVNPKEG